MNNVIEFIREAVGMYIVFLGGILVVAIPIIPFIENGSIGAALFYLIFGGSLIITGISIVGKNNL
jgi:hypothetical protein